MSGQQVLLPVNRGAAVRAAWDRWAWSQVADDLGELAYSADETELIMMRPVPPGCNSDGGLRWAPDQGILDVRAGDVIARGFGRERLLTWEVLHAGCLPCLTGGAHSGPGCRGEAPGWKVRPHLGKKVGIRNVGPRWWSGPLVRSRMVRPAVLPSPAEARAWQDIGLGGWSGPVSSAGWCHFHHPILGGAA